MFYPAAFDDLVVAAERAFEQPVALATNAEAGEALRALARVRDTLDGLQASLLRQFDVNEGPADDGSSTVHAWSRQHLRLDAGSSRRLVAAGRTLETLPLVRAAARSGEVRLEHVAVFTMALTKLGTELVTEAQPWLLDVARSCDPGELRQVVNQLVDAADPERPDDDYAAGMDRRDVRLARTTGGFHLSGFLDTLTGTRLKTWLEAASAPVPDAETGERDRRSPSERRVQAVDDLVSATLEHGMPRSGGVRPALHVTIEADTLAAMATGEIAGAPATLSGYGPIGPALTAELMCEAVARGIVVDGATQGPTPHARVLDVGREHRLATPAQRVAVIHRQDGHCATPGCLNTRLQVHHVAWWDRDGGRTDLDNLVGLCSACHTNAHLERLTISPDGAGGFTFAHRVRTHGRRRAMHDHRRTTRHGVRTRMATLRDALRHLGGTDHVSNPVSNPVTGQRPRPLGPPVRRPAARPGQVRRPAPAPRLRT